MIQMKVDPVNIIPINYNDPFIPDSLQRFNPTLYKQGDFFCCILGPNPQRGIFGCGHSPDAAINAWNAHFLEQLTRPTADNEVIQYVLDHIDASDTPVW